MTTNERPPRTYVLKTSHQLLSTPGVVELSGILATYGDPQNLIENLPDLTAEILEAANLASREDLRLQLFQSLASICLRCAQEKDQKADPVIIQSLTEMIGSSGFHAIGAAEREKILEYLAKQDYSPAGKSSVNEPVQNFTQQHYEKATAALARLMIGKLSADSPQGKRLLKQMKGSIANALGQTEVEQH